MTLSRFWLVWNPDGRAPTRRHSSRESASGEARRLAAIHPEQTFIVLKSVAAWMAPPPEPERIRFEEPAATDEYIPF